MWRQTASGSTHMAPAQKRAADSVAALQPLTRPPPRPCFRCRSATFPFTVPEPQWAVILEVVLTIYFAADYCLRMFLAQVRGGRPRRPALCARARVSPRAHNHPRPPSASTPLPRAAGPPRVLL